MSVNPKLKKMFESLNENDLESARSLFHDVVVEMSKEIYKEMDDQDDLEFDFQDDSAMLDSDFDKEDELDLDIKTFLDEDDEDGVVDDLEADLDVATDGDSLELDADFEEEVPGDESGSDELEDRIEDIELAFDEFKREFEEIMASNDEDEDATNFDVEDEVTDNAVSDLDDLDGNLEESAKKSGKILNLVKGVKPKIKKKA